MFSLLKKNQKSLYQDIKEKTASNNTINLKYNDCDYEIFTLKKNYIGLEFEGQKSYIKMTSYKRKKQDVKNVQTLFFLSSLKEPKLIVEAIDNRWNIENDLHKTKDELFNEDYYTFTDKNAIKVMAVLNNICYSLYKIMTAFLHNKDLTYTKIEFKDNPERVLGKIIPLLEKDNFEELIRSNLKGRKK